MSTFYVTTAIPYVNSDPHVGFALEAVVADAIARHRRSRGDDVRFLSGTDDNSLKSVRAAEREGVPVADLVARHSTRFQGLRETLDLSIDDFIQTSSDPRHRPGVEQLWRSCLSSGDIYKGHYRGRYCVGCEQFLDDDELVDGRCPEHETAPELVDESNWFFRLSRYGEQLLKLVESNRLQIVPERHRNEVLSFIRSGLRDFSISRSAQRARGWGIPVPGDPSQVMYVWFDALGNYITALGYGESGELYERYWLKNPNRLHVIGKDIVRFHAVYWPAMLLSIGAPLPTTIVTHGFVTVAGRKVSKSFGTAVDPSELVDEFGVDAVRYFLLRHIRTTHDGDFTHERLLRARDADLADQLGNLVGRVCAMVDKYLSGLVPAQAPDSSALGDTTRALAHAVDSAMATFQVHEALRAVFRLVEAANRYVVETAPWVLARERDPRLTEVLADLCAAVRAIGQELHPFLPRTSLEILVRIAEPGGVVAVRPPLFLKATPPLASTPRSGDTQADDQ